jgi:putative ABC transport system permease protein
MYWRLIYETIRRPRTRRRALWSVIAIALGTAVAAAMLNVSIDIGDRMGEEVRALGPNVVITPAANSVGLGVEGDIHPVADTTAIRQQDLVKLKSIFWRNNIKSFAPFLSAKFALSTFKQSSASSANSASAVSSESSTNATVAGTWFDFPLVDKEEERFLTGVRSLNPGWTVRGEWATDAPQPSADSLPTVMIGERLARQLNLTPGDILSLGDPSASPVKFQVTGILTTGTDYDNQVLAPLAQIQQLTNRSGQVDMVLLSALIKPEDELSRRDPKSMSGPEYDRWFCAPYLSSIMFQIGGALPGTVVRPIREVAETQGSILSKLNILMALLAILALIAAAMGISSLASLTVLERRQEIAVMKAIGARDGLVSAFLMTEMGMQGLIGGLLGFFGGQLLAVTVGRAVFDTDVAMHWILLPAMIAIALTVSLAGTWLPVQRAVHQEPAPVLRGD